VIAVWTCRDPEAAWIAQMAADCEARHEEELLEEDIAIALALDPFEEAPVEHVPLAALWMSGLPMGVAA